MREHFDASLRDLQRRLAELSGLVERAVDDAVRAFVTRDGGLAGRVVDGDEGVDHAEVLLERQCLDTMARQHPMASDLRLLAAVLKINGELERIGDLAGGMAKHTWRIVAPPHPVFVDQVSATADLVRVSLDSAMEAFLTGDTARARAVWAADTEVDRRFGEMLDLCFDLFRGDDVSVEDVTSYVAVAHNLERIGDHVKNIAENVVFVVEGRIVRHNVEARIAPPPPEGV